MPPERIVGEQPRPFTARELLDSLIAFDRLLDHVAVAAIAWRARSPRLSKSFHRAPQPHEAEVLFTGYYQPVIDGSLTPGDGFDYPIYGVPADLPGREQVGANDAKNGETTPGRIE